MPETLLAPHFNEASGIAYHEFGDPEGRPLIFHHGWPSAGSQGKLLDGPGKALGVRVISPSRPGIAGSRWQGEDRGFSDWPQLLDRFLDDVGIEGKITVMGMSGGGPYTLATCRFLPDRIEQAGVVCGAGEVGSSLSDMVWPYRVMGFLNRRMPWSVGAMLHGFRAMMRVPGGGLGPGTKAAGLPELDRQALRDPELATVVSGSFAEAMEGETSGLIEDGKLYLQEWDFDPSEIDLPVKIWHGRLDKNITPACPRPSPRRFRRRSCTGLRRTGTTPSPCSGPTRCWRSWWDLSRSKADVGRFPPPTGTRGEVSPKA